MRCYVAPLFLVLVAAVPATVQAQQAATPAPSPDAVRYFTNTQNVRRIAVSPTGEVALATSGGVRLLEGSGGATSRILTRNNGLPTHNVFDVAFDPKDPNTLWALCGSWQDKPRQLYLVTIDRKAGTARTISTQENALAAYEFNGLKFFADYRLSVGEDGTVLVAVGRGRSNDALLAYKGGTWTTTSIQNAGKVVPPRPNAGAEWAKDIAPGSVLVLPTHVLLYGSGGFLVYDREHKTVASYPFPKPDQSHGYSFDGTVAAITRGFRSTGVPFDLTAEPGGTFKFSLLEQTYTFEQVKQDDGRTIIRAGKPERSMLQVRFPTGLSNNGGYQLLSRTKLSEEEGGEVARRAQEAMRAGRLTNLLHGGQLTDVLEAGGVLWLATYNHPGRRAEGIVRYDLQTKTATYPAVPPGGIAANMVNDVRIVSKKTIALTTNGPSTFDPTQPAAGFAVPSPSADGSFYASLYGPPPTPPGQGVRKGTAINDPESKNRNLFAIADAAPGEDIWVRWTERVPEDDRTVMMERLRAGTYRSTPRIWHVGCIRAASPRTLETFDTQVPELKTVRALTFLLQQKTGLLFLFGADEAEVTEKLAAAEANEKIQAAEAEKLRTSTNSAALDAARLRAIYSRPLLPVSPVLLIWDTKTGQVVRQPARRGNGTRLPAWYRDVTMQVYSFGTMTGGLNLFEAAGEVWAHTSRFPEGSALYRFDSQAVDWTREGAYARVYPYTDSLFAIYGEWPRDLDVLRRDPERRRKLEGELRRWTQGTGWERWDSAGEPNAFLPLLQNGFLREGLPGQERYWIGGIGLTEVPAASMRFVPLNSATSSRGNR